MTNLHPESSPLNKGESHVVETSFILEAVMVVLARGELLSVTWSRGKWEIRVGAKKYEMYPIDLGAVPVELTPFTNTLQDWVKARVAKEGFNATQQNSHYSVPVSDGDSCMFVLSR